MLFRSAVFHAFGFDYQKGLMGFMVLLSKVAAEAVQERDYFLSAFNNPLVINGIRIACVAGLIIFLLCYRKYRKKS